MDLNIETVDDIEIRSRQLLQKIDDVTADLYSLGGLEERISFMTKFQELITEKDLAGDQVAIDVLNWAWQRLAEAD
jgi:hypothetical protein